MITALSKLGLAAAQFGLGAATPPRGRSPEAETGTIFQVAARAGLSVLDTSGVYGRGESLLGQLMPRPMPFRVTIGAARCDRGPDYVEAEARASLKRLGVQRADAIIVQSAHELFSPMGAALWRRLQELREAGLFKKIGVSVHASDDPIGVTKRFRPDIVQAPASLLDQRLLVDGTLGEVSSLGVEVQLRSIFLHGLLFLPPDHLPARLKGAAGISRVRRLIAEGRSDPLQAALAFALSRKEATAVLVGVTSAAELQAVIAAAASPPPDLDWEAMAVEDPETLDADHWAAA
ncbi:MAG TPA: bifunctional regulator KidO [Caulobacteraceae bacterium]